MSLLGMISGLVEADVRFVVIGGVAGAAHGSARVTVDLDICYAATVGNRERLASRLAAWKAYPRGIEPGLPFLMDARTLKDSEVLTLTTSRGDLDCLQQVAGVGDYAACAAKSERVTVDEVTFRVLNLDALIVAKRAAGRARDRDHLVELEALAESRKRGGRQKP